jgi:hypothetical protein
MSLKAQEEPTSSESSSNQNPEALVDSKQSQEDV